MSPTDPPSLDTPEGMDAYRRELRTVGRPLRYGGLALILVGAGIGSVERFTDIAMPAWSETAVLAFIVAGWALMMVAIVMRTMHHRRRFSGKAGTR